MPGIFDAIFGNSSPQPSTTQDPAAAAVMSTPVAAPAATPAAAPADTLDGQGLSSGDRFQAGMSGLSQLGATLLAAGQPMWGPDRARILAQLGNVPEAISQSMNSAAGRRKNAQAMKMSDAQLKAQAAMQEMANGDMSAFSPEMRSLMKAAYLSGKPEVAIAAMKEAREANKPVNLGGGSVAYKKPDGTYEGFNPLYNIRFPLDGSGKPAGNGTYGSTGTPVEPADMDVNADSGFRDTWLAKQGHDASYDARLKRIAQGDEQFPGMRDPMRFRLLNDLGVFAPNVREQDYSAKQQAIKAVQPGGKEFDKTIRPGAAFLNHAASLAAATDALGLDDGTIAKNGGNWVALQLKKNGSADDQRAVAKWEEYKSKVTDEFNKFMRGNGGLTDQAQREGAGLKEAKTPAEIKGRLDAMTDMMHGQLARTATGYLQAMKKPSAQPADLLGADAVASLGKVHNWINGSSRGGGSPSASAGGSIPAGAAAKLKANPGLRDAFESKYGPGSAASVLGQ